MEYLIAVKLRGLHKNSSGFISTERALYRVPCSASMQQVVNHAVLRSNLVDQNVICTSVEVLGTLDKHLSCLYVPLLMKCDVTDMVQP
jgi:hypothetical protein